MKRWAMPAACISTLDALGANTPARVGPMARSGGEIISTNHFKLIDSVYLSWGFLSLASTSKPVKCKPFNKAHAQATKHFFMPCLTDN